MPAHRSPLPHVLVTLLWPSPEGVRAVDLWRVLQPRPSRTTVLYHLAALIRTSDVQRVARGRYALSDRARRRLWHTLTPVEITPSPGGMRMTEYTHAAPSVPTSRLVLDLPAPLVRHFQARAAARETSLAYEILLALQVQVVREHLAEHHPTLAVGATP